MEQYYDIRIPDTGHEFEILSKIVCEHKFGVTFGLYGRNGQEQNGIDLFSNSFRICVQCKNYQGNDACKSLLRVINSDFISAYHKFGAEMETYVVTTTAPRDTRIQDAIAALSREYTIDIQVLFWEDFQAILKVNPGIIDEYNTLVSSPGASADRIPVCALTVERNDNNICLDRTSVENLKKVCRSFQEGNRHSVNIELSIKDYDDLSILLEREDLREGYGGDVVKFVASQSLRKNYRANKTVLETAIEFMMQDEMLDSWSHLSSQKYIDAYGIDACYYHDSYGIVCYYWQVFLWVEIIEELIKQFVEDRTNYYGNNRNFTAIDCCARTNTGTDLWYFISFISNTQTDNRYQELYSNLRWVLCDYMDIPPSDLIAHLYPDFFFNIGLLKQRNRQRFDYLSANYPKVFNLYYYTFGLH